MLDYYIDYIDYIDYIVLCAERGRVLTSSSSVYFLLATEEARVLCVEADLRLDANEFKDDCELMLLVSQALLGSGGFAALCITPPLRLFFFALAVCSSVSSLASMSMLLA